MSHHLFDRLPQCVLERRHVQRNFDAASLVQQPAHRFRVELLPLEYATQVSVNGKLRGRLKSARQRDPQIGQKPHERNAQLVDLAVVGFGFRETRSQDSIKHAALLVAEEERIE